MEEGTKTKKTVFIGGLGDDVDEAVIYENFSTFGNAAAYSYPIILTYSHPTKTHLSQETSWRSNSPQPS